MKIGALLISGITATVLTPALALAQLVLQLTKAVLVGRPPDQDETA